MCGLSVNRARDETVRFVNSFTPFLDISDAYINKFVKITHTTNSACPTNGKNRIRASSIVDLKALRFELEYRARYGALPFLAKLQSLDAV